MKVHRFFTQVVAFPAVLGLCLAATPPLRAQEDASALIEQLVEVNSPNTFYSGTFRFTEFPPLDEAPLAPFPLPGNRSSEEAAFRALIRLIELGPEALPALLAHLDDERGTNTKVPDDLAKSLGPSSFVDYRPGDPREEAAIQAASLPFDNPGPDFDGLVEDYALTVGDMCFALIGMITNRSYYVVVDEFEAQLNSPTRSDKIVSAVRDTWGPAPVPTDLYARLKNDLEQGEHRFAVSAATRLLYYFPTLSDNLVIAHLNRLIKEHEAGSEDLADFLNGIAWSSNPRIQSTLRRFLTSANDGTQIAAAARVYATTRDPRAHEELMQLTDRLKLRRDPSFVNASRTLLELSLLTFPDRKNETVTRFLDGAGAYAATSACLVCETIEDPPIPALARLLSNKGKSTGDRYLIKGERAEKWPEDDDYLPYRICDRAYVTISRILGDRDTVASGTQEEMDARIQKLVKRLSREPSRWPLSASEIKARQDERTRQARSDS